MSITVMLRKDAQGTHRRTLRDEDGEAIVTLEFDPGVPVILSPEEFEACKVSIGSALLIVEPDERGRPVPLSAEETEDILAGRKPRKRRRKPADQGHRATEGHHEAEDEAEGESEAGSGEASQEG